jgi:type IV pilus assembly protein PilP
MTQSKLVFQTRPFCNRLQKWMTICSVAILSACSGGEQVEIKDWMKTQRAKTPASVSPVIAPVPFVPAPYTQAVGADPFDDLKLKAALAKARAASGVSALQPDLSRKREALESFPLDNLKMIGYVLKQGKPTALISAAGTLFNVVVGNYVGQDFGKVISITEQEVAFKELVQDGAGIWTERTTKLPLIVAAKENKK